MKSLPEALDRNLALSQAAYVYDNALAAIAFVACGRVSEARRIADALVAAASHDGPTATDAFATPIALLAAIRLILLAADDV